jgi:hypothetical protein
MLADVQAHEVAALIGATGLQLQHRVAHFVAFAGSLHLDHTCAKVCEQARAVRARQNAGEIEDGEPGEKGLAGAGGGGWFHERCAEGGPSGRRKEYNIMKAWFFRERALSALPARRSSSASCRGDGGGSFVSIPSRVAAEKRISQS